LEGWLQDVAALTGGQVEVMQRRGGAQGIGEMLDFGDFITKLGMRFNPLVDDGMFVGREVIEGVARDEGVVGI
jgi:hypothetical protein